MSNIDLIIQSQKYARNIVYETPLLFNSKVNEILGKNIFIKPECLQITGSFKFRGAWCAISHLKKENKILNGVVAYSSGNHAQGVAAACKAHDIPSLIVMPKDAPKQKISNTLDYNSEIIFYDRYTEIREKIGENIANEKKLTLIKPYDEDLIIAGQGTCGLEIIKQSKKLGIEKAEVLVCCGGGGLSAGISLALEKYAPFYKLRTCEPEFYDDTARSLKSGKREINETNNPSICDAILTPTPGELTFPILKRNAGEGLVVSEKEVLKAMKFLYQHFKIVSEPGGAVAAAAAIFSADKLNEKDIIVVVSGGNVDSEIFSKAISENI